MDYQQYKALKSVTLPAQSKALGILLLSEHLNMLIGTISIMAVSFFATQFFYADSYYPYAAAAVGFLSSLISYYIFNFLNVSYASFVKFLAVAFIAIIVSFFTKKYIDGNFEGFEYFHLVLLFAAIVAAFLRNL